MQLNLGTKKNFSEANMRRIISILTGLMSSVSSLEDQCIKEYDDTVTYQKGQIVIGSDGYFYEAKTVATGTWDVSKWTKIGTDDITELDLDTIKGFLGLTQDQLDTLAKIIKDDSIELSKTWSSSKIYTDIQDTLKEAKQYCITELAKKSTGSFKKANDTTEVTDGNYLYLILNPSTSKYDIYALVDSNVELLTSVDVNLDDYYTKTEVDNDFLKKTDATSTYATIATVDNDRANVNKMINHISKYVAIDAPRDSNNMLERLYVGGGYVSYQEFQDSTVTKDFKVFSQKYGLTPIVLGNGDDLNDITRNTFFTANKPCANTPYPEGNFIGISAAHVSATGYGFQIACGANENQRTSKTRAVYIRHNYNNVWGEWDRILTSGNQTSKPNLLDNPWFTVNQRGQSSYTNTSSFYGVDRWMVRSDAKLNTIETVNSDGTITITNDSGNSYILQYLREYKAEYFIGKEVTFSVMKGDSTIISHTFIYTSATSGMLDWDTGDSEVTKLRWQYQNSGCFTPVIFYNSGATIKAIKLEIGKESTLHLDIQPNYATELIKCQRHFIKYYNLLLTVTANDKDSTLLFAPITFPTNMRLSGGTTKISNYNISYVQLNGVRIDKSTIAEINIFGVNNNVGYIQIGLSYNITTFPTTGLLYFTNLELSSEA